MQARRDALDEAIKTAKADETRARLVAAREAEAAAAKEHFERMFTEIGQPLAGLTKDQHGAVYELAYQQGHSSGYDEVETYYGEFAELARKILALR